MENMDKGRVKKRMLLLVMIMLLLVLLLLLLHYTVPREVFTMGRGVLSRAWNMGVRWNRDRSSSSGGHACKEADAGKTTCTGKGMRLAEREAYHVARDAPEPG